MLAEERLACLEAGGITVVGFLENHVRPHLANQAHRMKHGYYVNGEYAHGEKGILEYYQRQLGVENPMTIAKILMQIAKGRGPDRRAKCFCGSGKKFWHCHRAVWQRLERLGKEILLHEVQQMYGFASLLG